MYVIYTFLQYMQYIYFLIYYTKKAIFKLLIRKKKSYQNKMHFKAKAHSKQKNISNKQINSFCYCLCIVLHSRL